MTRNLPLGLVGFLLLGPCGCVTTRQEVYALRPAPAAERGIIFSVDGAGGFQSTSAALSQAAFRDGLPLRVEPVPWSHGRGRVLADQMDFCHAREEGERLAVQVAAYRRAHPGNAIYLVGHSAGSAVVLTAVEVLPPGTVDRVVLLAPSVSADYDLRPALRSVRWGIDVFCSRRDWFFLGLGTSVVGTADRHWGAASGRVGFRPQGSDPEDAALYAKLRQHPWHTTQLWTGNQGGHYGGYQPRFLQAYVLPLFREGPQAG